MSVSDAVLSYLRVLIWPALICVLAFGFRSTIRSLLQVRLTQIDAAGFSAKFEDIAQDAKRLVQSGQPPGTSLPSKPLSKSDFVHFWPQSYGDARAIGEAFRAGKPVVVDLTQTDNTNARHLLDFCAGLVFMDQGAIDLIHTKVFSMTPAAFLAHSNAAHRENGEPVAPK